MGRPRSGEIINASVLMYNDVVKLAANWRFVQTAQVDDACAARSCPTTYSRSRWSTSSPTRWDTASD
ncbi:MAG: hypothetical protein ACLUGU_17345 [Alistipes shahii]